MSTPRARPRKIDAVPDVSIVIPTMRRPEALMRAARSALGQTAPGATVELVIVDNDPAASARAAVQALAKDAPIDVSYVHAAEPGVANARNAGTAASRGGFIAFLDDDEDAPEGWLAELLAAQHRFEADAVFGPVRARVPEAIHRHRAYFEAFFSRLGPEEACTVLSGPGCGCSLIRRDALPGDRPFSSSRNGTGGEDDLLFAEMKAAGARFAWAPDAWVWEDPEPSRLTLDYTLRRAFAYGQGPNSAAAARGLAGWQIIPVWTLIGAAQLALYGLLGAARTLSGSPRAAYALDRAARGLGKMLWFPPFKIGFYGQAALDRQIRADLKTKALAAVQPSIDTFPLENDHARHQDLDARAVG
jgi:hypothetical protein